MFLKRVCNHILSTVTTVNANTVRALNIALGKSETELVNKWKQRFADENISEIEPSIRHILEHVIRKEKVKYFNGFVICICIYQIATTKGFSCIFCGKNQ